MARHIRVPGVVDLLLVTDPPEIRALNEDPGVDRKFLPRGPLVNQLIAGRIWRWFEIKGEPLPSLAPRADKLRASKQRELARALDPASGKTLWSGEQISKLASFVRGRGTNESAAITIQEIVGRQFDPQYRADQESWQAAALIDRFREGFSPLQIVWQITGRLKQAFALLIRRAKEDRWAMHGTAIGVHGIVRAIGRMRQLRAEPHAGLLSIDAVLGRCLAPPARVPRTIESNVPFGTGELRPGTLAILKLDNGEATAPGGEAVFMAGHWNSCPAQAFVTALLQEVWRRSLTEGA
ncbi:MAG: hypothetical protein J2P49_09195 [Methylocapsa sp.]|nr:hypothetical protein [Methylocapsa sp.]